MTDAALEKARGAPALYDAIFGLFKTGIAVADPGYARAIDLDRLTADDFADACFADRKNHDPFRWVRENLEEVERNKLRRITVPWRYAILRMHEKVEALVEYLSEADRERFDTGLKKVSTDNYAAVPPRNRSAACWRCAMRAFCGSSPWVPTMKRHSRLKRRSFGPKVKPGSSTSSLMRAGKGR